MRMTPAQNIHSPQVMLMTHGVLRRLSSVVGSWYSKASLAERSLLAGIKLGCEAGIGWQTWDYPQAVSYPNPKFPNANPNMGLPY